MKIITTTCLLLLAILVCPAQGLKYNSFTTNRDSAIFGIISNSAAGVGLGLSVKGSNGAPLTVLLGVDASGKVATNATILGQPAFDGALISNVVHTADGGLYVSTTNASPSIVVSNNGTYMLPGQAYNSTINFGATYLGNLSWGALDWNAKSQTFLLVGTNGATLNLQANIIGDASQQTNAVPLANLQSVNSVTSSNQVAAIVYNSGAGITNMQYWMNGVTDFGLDNTGMTDNGANLSNAVAVANYYKRPLYLRAGIYAFSEPISLSNGASIIGDGGIWGPATILRWIGTNQYAISSVTNSRSSFLHLKDFELYNASGTSNNIGIGLLGLDTNSTTLYDELDNLLLVGFGTNLLVIDTEASTFDHIYCAGGGVGIYACSTLTSGAEALNNKFIHCRAGQCGSYGFLLGDQQASTFDSCAALECGSNGVAAQVFGYEGPLGGQTGCSFNDFDIEGNSNCAALWFGGWFNTVHFLLTFGDGNSIVINTNSQYNLIENARTFSSSNAILSASTYSTTIIHGDFLNTLDLSGGSTTFYRNTSVVGLPSVNIASGPFQVNTNQIKVGVSEAFTMTGDQAYFANYAWDMAATASLWQMFSLGQNYTVFSINTNGTTTVSNLVVNGTLSVSNLNATGTFTGNGSGLTNLPWGYGFSFAGNPSIPTNASTTSRYFALNSSLTGNSGSFTGSPLRPGTYGMFRVAFTPTVAMATTTNVTLTFCTNTWANSTPVATSVVFTFSGPIGAYAAMALQTNYAATITVADGSYGCWLITNSSSYSGGNTLSANGVVTTTISSSSDYHP